MGYTTDFRGRINLSRELTPEEYATLEEFSETRHGGNLRPHNNVPGFWCDWAPTDDRQGIEWNGSEKFYNYVEWMRYLIREYLEPWDITANGRITWRGENFNDMGRLIVEGNIVTTATYVPDEAEE